MKRENIIKYANPILAIVLVALLGAIFTNFGLNWLDSLNKPNRWLPNYVIPIVWGIIYTLFAIYLLVLTNKNKFNTTLLTLLIINGFLNVFWCLIFFSLKNILPGLIIIIVNLIASILLIKNIYRSNKKWGYILLIYPTWLSIATCLNLSIWILN